MKIVNFKKFILSSTLVIIMVLSILILVSNSALSFAPQGHTTVYVENGDTLWSIAQNQRENNAYYEGKDIRYIVKDIRKVNNLNDCNLSIGQVLTIPTV